MSGKRGKNDAADAAAICEAVARPNMRFVPVKEEHQQIILTLHRTRQGFVEERTATYNRLRGLMSEFGIVLPQKVACLRGSVGAHLEDLPGYLRSLLVMGARAILSGLGDKQDGFSRWARSLVERRGYWRAVVAIAAKNARLAWAVLRYGEDFRLNPDVA